MNFTPISFYDNSIGDDTTQLMIENALEINQNILKIWTKRKYFLTFLSQFSDTLLPGHVNVVSVNLGRVLELEEMKREITNFL